MGTLEFLECVFIFAAITCSRHDGGEEAKRVYTEREQAGRRSRGGLRLKDERLKVRGRWSRLQVTDTKSEVRGRESEVVDQRSGVRGRGSEVVGPRSWVRDHRSEVVGQGL